MADAADPGAVTDMVDAVSPLVATVTAAVSAQEAMCGSGLPAAASIAMAEVAAEEGLADALWPEPVHAAQSLAGVLRVSVSDHVRSYVHLFESQPVPVYAHLTVARAALETAGYAHWLSEPSIGAEQRMYRSEVLRLRNAKELKRSGIEANKDRGKEIIENIRAGAAARGVHAMGVKDGQPAVGGQELPRPRRLIADVYAGDGSESMFASDFADALWWYMSGVSHGVTHALMQSIEPAAASVMAAKTANVYTSSRGVLMYGTVIAASYLNLVERQQRLFGWVNADWDEARTRVRGVIQQVLTLATTSG